jgi:hypothetical protein
MTLDPDTARLLEAGDCATLATDVATCRQLLAEHIRQSTSEINTLLANRDEARREAEMRGKQMAELETLRGPRDRGQKPLFEQLRGELDHYQEVIDAYSAQGKELAALRAALTECRDWLKHRVLDIIPEDDRPATEARLNLATHALDEYRELFKTDPAAAQWVRVPEDWDQFVSLVIHACREASRWRMKDGSECWCNRGQPSHSPGCKALAAAYEQAQRMFAAPQAGEPRHLTKSEQQSMDRALRKSVEIVKPQAGEPEGE